MLEMVPACTLALYLLAGAARQFRSRAGIGTRRQVTALRLTSAAILLFAAVSASPALTGERWIWLLGACSICAITLTLLLSAAPAAALSPLRWIMLRRLRG